MSPRVMSSGSGCADPEPPVDERRSVHDEGPSNLMRATTRFVTGSMRVIVCVPVSSTQIEPAPAARLRKSLAPSTAMLADTRPVAISRRSTRPAGDTQIEPNAEIIPCTPNPRMVVGVPTVRRGVGVVTMRVVDERGRVATTVAKKTSAATESTAVARKIRRRRRNVVARRRTVVNGFGAIASSSTGRSSRSRSIMVCPPPRVRRARASVLLERRAACARRCRP